MPIPLRPEHSPSILARAAWQRVLVIALVCLLLWLGVCWAIAGSAS